jgi:hypothetical protein
MAQMTIERSIEAPIDWVFKTISEISEFSKAIPHIVKVEFLTEQRVGTGTRFRETRIMQGKEVAVELSVADSVPNERVRMVTEMNGTVRDTVLEVRPHSDGTTPFMVLNATAKSWLGRVRNFFMIPMIKKSVAKDIDMVKEYCEKLISRDF